MNNTGSVLLVEDDANIQRINRRILEREGFYVYCAACLQEAYEILNEHTPDVLVLDIMLPDGSGLAFCEKIRPKTTIPVLFLTALDEKNEIIQGLVAGGNDYITKPYDVDEFVARVNAQLRLARMNQQAIEQIKTITRGPLSVDTVALCELLNRIQKSVSEKFLSEINRNNTKNNVKYGFFYVIRWNKLTLL